MLQFVAELRKLFALMLKSNRKVINPSQTLKCLKNCSKYDVELFNQEDVSEFTTILVNLIEESFNILYNIKQQQACISQESTVSKDQELLNISDLSLTEASDQGNLKKNKSNPIVSMLNGDIIVNRKNSGEY